MLSLLTLQCIAAALGYTEQILVGWSSGGAMASAFLNYAHQTGFSTANKTKYSIKGLVLLASGGQFCYAYDTVADLVGLGKAGGEFWGACTTGDRGPTPSCCPQNLTEDYCESKENWPQKTYFLRRAIVCADVMLLDHRLA